MAGFVDIYRMAMGWWSKPAQTGGGWCEAMDIFVPGADDMATFHAGADQASIFVPGADQMEIT